ncbi:MAG: type III pantothenate kinase [Ruminococcus sp.]|nr:type III pantothenate kinase [Ruminococcus sp.]
MLLTADIGNTNIKFGIFNGRELMRTLTISCNKAKTADEYGVELYSLIRVMGIHRDDFDGCIISSVVPLVTTRIEDAVRDILGVEPMIVGPGVKTGLNIRIEDPSTLGADLVVACVAANALKKGPKIVISMGTATAWCVIDGSNSMIGVPIAPGVAVSLEALTKNTALLQSVAFKAPSSVIGKNTDKSIRAGVVWGTVCMIDGMIDRIEKELGTECTVFATGGLAQKIIRYCEHDIEIRENLILEGLRLIYERNVKR